MPDSFSKNIVYLSEAQRQELFANNTITVNGVTVNYNENDIYVTPQAEPVTDVRVNGTSVTSNGVANVPIANDSRYGVVKTSAYTGIIVSDETLVIDPSNSAGIKAGNGAYKPIVTSKQHESAFYGLAKAAGADMKDIANTTVGIYPDAQKAAIQNMLGITDLISTEESSTATAAHALNSTFMMDGKLHRATAAIAIGDAVEVGTNCEVVKADEVFVKNTDFATDNTAGVIKIGNGLTMTNGKIYTYPAIGSAISGGTDMYKPITPRHQHESVYYSLSKLAGVDLAAETVTVGTYPETSKAAIRSMLGAASPNVIAVQDTQPTNSETKVWLPETQAAGVEVPTYAEFQALDSSVVKKTDYATVSTAGIVKVGSDYGVYMGVDNILRISSASTIQIKTRSGSTGYHPITVWNLDPAVFYGLAGAAGDTTQAESNNAVGTYTDDAKAAIQTMLGVPGDVQVNGTSVVSNGVANIPKATDNSSNLGVVGTEASFGIRVNASGKLYTDTPTSAEMKTGTNAYKPIVPATQHTSTFYGLAKAAGDTTQSSSSNAIGTYTAEALAAIHTMLGIDPASIASQVEIPLVETVTGTTPSITGQPNTRYNCGEVSTLSITPPASGSIDVIFESGSTPTVITVPNTVKWPAWFDATALEADTTYEILITDGVYGSVMTWAT